MQEVKPTLVKGFTGMFGAFISQMDIQKVDAILNVAGKAAGLIVAFLSIWSLSLSIRKQMRALSSSSSSSSSSICSLASLFLILITVILFRL